MKYLKVLGPYLRKDGRSHVVVKLESGKYKTISYPRYLVEKQLGRRLRTTEDVHHIDGNFRNNNLTNLEVLHTSTHISNHSSKEDQWIKFECPFCFAVVKKSYRGIKGNWSKGKAGPFCSRKCAGSLPSFVGKSRIVEVSESLKGETL